MVLLILSIVAITGLVGAGVYVHSSKKKYEEAVSNMEMADDESAIVDIKMIEEEVDRVERLKDTLREARKNVEKIDIPVPESISYNETTQSSLNKISRFSEKYSKGIAGTEQLVLGLLPVSETGHILSSFAATFPEQLGDAAQSAIAAMKDAAYAPKNMGELMSMVGNAMQHVNPQSLANALSHHDYVSLLLKPGKAMVTEMSGVHEGMSDLTSSFSEIKDNFANSIGADSLTDITDFDVSGHIPVMTIAMSSFREFQLLTKNKTDAISSLKNIGLDAAGSGVGALAGAKAGAIAGSLFGPVGAALGGLIGGIGGAMGGRMISNEVKQAPLKNAISNYQSSYEKMNRETEAKSKKTLANIHDFTVKRRNEFKNEKVLSEIPVVDSETIITQISVTLYQYLLDYIDVMKSRCDKVKASFWYKEEKHGTVINRYMERIAGLEAQLIPIENIKENPILAIESLLSIKMPKEITTSEYEKNLSACTEELKELNNKNDSSILVWTYMVNGAYQKAIRDITEFNNREMTSLNQFFESWKTTMTELGKKVDKEKSKLGLN
jgi:hypothetical protein